MPKSSIRMATVSDIHLGHPTTPAWMIVENFDRAFFQDPQNQHLDILYFAGDIFDRLLYLSQDDVLVIDRWIKQVLRYCEIHGIIFRVLEGTPSHDRNQSKRFDLMRSLLGIDINYNYIQTISIEYIEALDIHVLYVPDQPSISPDTVLATVDELMIARGLTQVDYAIMHGHFKHQLPAAVKHPAHMAEAYLKRVKYLIFVGHEHTSSVYERIIAEGSFDRLRQGQEEAKGYYRATVELDGTYTATFVENTQAKIYKTLDLLDKDLAASMAFLDKVTPAYPEDSHLRLLMHRQHPWANNLNAVKQRYPRFNWGKKLVSEDKSIAEVLPTTQTEFVARILDKDTLPTAIMERIQRKPNVSPRAWQVIENYLGIVRG